MQFSVTRGPYERPQFLISKIYNEARLGPNNNDNNDDGKLRGKENHIDVRERKKLHNFNEIWEQGYVGSFAMYEIAFDIKYFHNKINLHLTTA